MPGVETVNLAPEAGAPVVDRARQRAILFLMAISSFVLTADYSITGVALPSIGAQFGTPPSTLAVVVVADTLAIASLLIVGGRFVDRFGHRTMLRVGLAIYALGSLVAGIAPNIYDLAAARVLQGVATALVSPASFSLIAGFLPEGPARQRALGVYASTQGLSVVLGLLVGGWVVGRIGWHAAYLMVLPLIVVGFILATTVLPRRDAGRRQERIDLLGAVLVTLAMIATVSSFMTIGGAGFTTSVAVRLAIAAALFAIFARVESRTVAPLVPPDLFRQPGFTVCCLIIFLFMGASAGLFVVMQMNLQRLLGFSAAAAGFASLPSATASILSGSLIPPLLKRFSARSVLIGAGLCEIAGFAMLAVMIGKPYVASVLPGGLVATTAGFVAFMAIIDIATSRLPGDRQGVGTGVLFTSYQLGIAALTSLALGMLDQSQSAISTAGFVRAYVLLALALCIGLAFASVPRLLGNRASRLLTAK